MSSASNAPPSIALDLLPPILDALGNPAAMNPIKALFHASESKDDLEFLVPTTEVILIRVILHGAKDSMHGSRRADSAGFDG